jgi:hypothetical protein
MNEIARGHNYPRRGQQRSGELVRRHFQRREQFQLSRDNFGSSLPDNIYKPGDIVFAIPYDTLPSASAEHLRPKEVRELDREMKAQRTIPIFESTIEVSEDSTALDQPQPALTAEVK